MVPMTCLTDVKSDEMVVLLCFPHYFHYFLICVDGRMFLSEAVFLAVISLQLQWLPRVFSEAPLLGNCRLYPICKVGGMMRKLQDWL